MAAGTQCTMGLAGQDNCPDTEAFLQTTLQTHGKVDAGKPDGQIKVLDVGAPRTGTQSLAEALTRLGYNPCHSGEHMEVRPTLCKYWKGEGTWEEVEEMMKKGGWDGGMDEVFHLLYEDVVKKYPASKFILPIRKAEDWYESYLHFFRSNPELKKIDDTLGAWDECNAAHYFGCDFTEIRRPLDESRDDCITGYNRHVERVMTTIPSDRLLLFNMSEGYTPLCNFLGKDVPMYPNGTEEPFPHSDLFGTGKFGKLLGSLVS